MSIPLHFIVEGQTERQFIHEIIIPHLYSFGIQGIVQIMTTSIHSKTFRGGVGTYTQIQRNIRKALNRTDSYVTTMFDLYGLPHDTPGYHMVTDSMSGKEKVTIYEASIREAISNRRLIPHIQLYEYETLLFSDINAIDSVIGMYSPSQKEKLQEIVRTAGEPEKINDNPNTAPSKRLYHMYPSYQKNPHNILIIKKIPLHLIRSTYPHFDSWLKSLEQLTPLSGES